MNNTSEIDVNSNEVDIENVNISLDDNEDIGNVMNVNETNAMNETSVENGEVVSAYKTFLNKSTTIVSAAKIVMDSTITPFATGLVVAFIAINWDVLIGGELTNVVKVLNQLFHSPELVAATNNRVSAASTNVTNLVKFCICNKY